MIRVNPDGAINGYILSYFPDVNWVMASEGEANMQDYTGLVYFSTLAGYDRFRIAFDQGRGFVYEVNYEPDANGRGDCMDDNCPADPIGVLPPDINLCSINPCYSESCPDYDAEVCAQQTELDEIMECEELTDAQLNQLSDVLNEYLHADYLASCLNLQVHEQVVDGNKKLCFKMGTDSGLPGGYNIKFYNIF